MVGLEGLSSIFMGYLHFFKVYPSSLIGNGPVASIRPECELFVQFDQNLKFSEVNVKIWRLIEVVLWIFFIFLNNIFYVSLDFFVFIYPILQLRKWNERWVILDPSTGKMEYKYISYGSLTFFLYVISGFWLFTFNWLQDEEKWSKCQRDHCIWRK